MKVLYFLTLLGILFSISACDDDSTSSNENNLFWKKTSVSDGISFSGILISENETLIASTGDFGYQAINDGYIYRSDDFGNNWDGISLGVDATNCLIEHKSKLFAGTTQGIYYSDNDGVTWYQGGLDTLVVKSMDSYLLNNSNIIVAGTIGGVFKSDDDGMTWNKISDLVYPDCIGVFNENKIFAGQIGAVSGALFVTHDDGLSWDSALSGLGATYLEIVDDKIYVGGYRSEEWYGGLHLSTDGGLTWSVLYSDLESVKSSLITQNNTTYLCGYNTGVQMKKSGDLDWTELNSGLTSSWITDLAIDNNNYLYAVSDLGGIYKSSQPVE